MDIEKLIERLKHNYHGYSTVENNPEETFHDMVECLTALSTLQAENEKLREMYQKEKAVCHAVQAELAAAVEDVLDAAITPCSYCKHGPINGGICDMDNDNHEMFSCWEWRGPEEGNNGH